jgi:hypothetical protein
LPPLAKIVPALQDVGVPKMSPETGIRTTKYDDLGRMLNLTSKKVMEKKLSYIGKNQTRCKYGLLTATLEARKLQPKAEIAALIKSSLPATYQLSRMYVIDQDDIQTAGLLNVVINFLAAKQASGNHHPPQWQQQQQQ